MPFSGGKRALASLAVLSLLLGAAGILPAPAASGPLPATLPFGLTFPLLEGPQVKIEVGYNGPSGNASSFIGTEPAMVNFSVWWWDTGAPTSALLRLDALPYVMTEVPGGAGNYSNGALFRTTVNATTLAAGEHSWYFDFTGPSGSSRLPSSSNFSRLMVDLAERFVTDNLRTMANSLANAYRGGSVPDLRGMLSRALNNLGPLMGSAWDPASGYTYFDLNHHIVQPVGLTADNKEAFVDSRGASRARYTDGANFAPNNQTALKQTLVTRAVLLATGLFNESDLEIAIEPLLVNGTAYSHPFLRVRLNDGSEAPGDGAADGDGLIDFDLWGISLPPSINVTFGKHFGEDGDPSNDAAYDGSVGWPPRIDPNALHAVWVYDNSYNVTLADGSIVAFYVMKGNLNAALTVPVAYGTYWNDEPVVFDGLSSNQSSYLDLRYDWDIVGTLFKGSGPVWVVDIIGLATYTVTLTATDPFGATDSSTVVFIVHAKTRIRNAIADQSVQEDASKVLDMRFYFADDDGFNTIQFTFATAAPQVTASYNAPVYLLTLTPATDWCNVTSVQITATDGFSPPVSQTFNLTVTCENDAPVIANPVPNVTFPEDTTYVVTGLGAAATDADGDTLTWSFWSSVITGLLDSANGTLTLTAPRNWYGIDSAKLNATDGVATASQNLKITVTPVNDDPVVNGSFGPFVVQEDKANVTLLLYDFFLDPDGDRLSAEVTGGPGLEAGYFDPLSSIWFRPTANFSGLTTFHIKVLDTTTGRLELDADVTVTEVNDPPVLLSAEPSSFATGAEGDLLLFLLRAFDSDSAALFYTFKLDGATVATGQQASFEWQTDSSSGGRHDLDVTVSDNAGGILTYHWSVLIADKNRPPTVMIRPSGNGTYPAGQAFTLMAVGVDPDGDTLTYTWSFGGALQPMTGASITVTFQSAGDYTVRVVASDGSTETVTTFGIHVTYEPPPPPDGNVTPPPPPTPTSPGFETVAGLSALASAAAAVAILVRRRSRR